MAERERERVDARALRIGVTRGAVGGALAYGFAYGLAFTLAPVVRDFNGQLPVPEPGAGFCGTIAAVVGLAVGWLGLRANRRLAGAAGAEYVNGASALARTRDRLAAERGRGAPVDAPVQRWSGDLLARGAGVPVQAVTDAE